MLSEVTYLNGEVSYEDIWHHDITSSGFRESERSVHVVESDGYHYYLAKVGAWWYLYLPSLNRLFRVYEGTKRARVERETKTVMTTIAAIKDMFNAF